MALTTHSTAPVPLVTHSLVLRPPSGLSSSWKRTQKIRYGSSTALLGTSPGGENLHWGPAYGAQLPDGTWWYADAAKRRLAHYDKAGRYLGRVKLPKKHLAQGVYFQWANPFALADGTLVLTSTTIDSPGLLRLGPGGTVTRVPMTRFVHIVVSDGTKLYGFDDDAQRVRVNPRTGKVSGVTAFTGQGGRTFDLVAAAGHLLLTRPGVNLRFDLVDAGYPSLTVHPSVEVAMSANGRLWILIAGVTELSPDTAHTVLGITSVDADGNISAVGRVRTLTSDSDPGDGKHLGVRYGGTRPTLMFVGTDAVRVYRKN